MLIDHLQHGGTGIPSQNKDVWKFLLETFPESRIHSNTFWKAMDWQKIREGEGDPGLFVKREPALGTQS